MVDRALLRLFNDRLPPIGPFFYNQTRTGAFATEMTNTFHYEPRTAPVSQAVVEEAELSTAMHANAAMRGAVTEQAAVQLGVAAPAPASAPAPAGAGFGGRYAGIAGRSGMRRALGGEKAKSALGDAMDRDEASDDKEANKDWAYGLAYGK